MYINPDNPDTVIKQWGQYKILHKTAKTLTKELYIKPLGCLSYQRHTHRAELWMIAEGELNLIINDSPVVLKEFNMIVIPKNHWHTAYVRGDQEPVKVIETWFSDSGVLDENDIERGKLPAFCPMHAGYNGI